MLAWLLPSVLALLACTAAPRLIDRPLPAGTSAPAAQQALAVAEPPPAADAELQSLLRRVSALRGLSPPPALQRVELSAHELAEVALARAAQGWPEPARRAQAQLLWRLGLLPAGADLLALLAPALEAQLEAFYARADGVPTLFVRSALSGAARRRAVAHELVHALQDHEHALLQRLADEAQSADQRSALHALAEADALAVVEQLGLAADHAPSAGPPALPSPQLPALPPVLLRLLEAPYRDGQARVAEALRAGGFRRVDRWLREPPLSTHALLQPTSAADAAVPLPVPPPPGADWQRGYSDVLGEQSLRTVLEEEGAAAGELAARWRADRFSVFELGESSALMWELELADADTAADVQVLLQRGRLHPEPGIPGGTALPGTEWTCGAHSDAGVVAGSRRGRQLVFASFTPGSQSVNVAAQCANLQQWIAALRFAPRPGSSEPHRSRHTPPDSRPETIQ